MSTSTRSPSAPSRAPAALVVAAALAVLAVPGSAHPQSAAPPASVVMHPPFAPADGYGQGVATDGTVLAATDLSNVVLSARTGTWPTWSEQAVLPLWSEWPVGSYQPRALAVEGERAYVGETGAPGLPSGAVRVLRRSGTSWIDEAVLTPPGLPPGEAFGTAADVDGARLVIGAPGSGGTGAVHVFESVAGTWTWRAKLVAHDAAPGDDFGAAVAVAGDLIAVGAPLADVAGLGNAGAAYVFEGAGAQWTETAKFTEASPGHGEGHFGWSVAADGDTVLVGSPNSDTQAAAWTGAGFVWVRSAGRWSPQGKLVGAPPFVVSGDGAGFSVALRGDRALLGAPFSGWTPSGQLAFVGNVLRFDRAGTAWSFSGLTGTAAPSGGEVLGWSVALAADTTVAGMPSWGLDGGAVLELSVGQTLPPWIDLGYGLAGTTGVPHLAGDGPLTAGSAGSLVLSEASRHAPALLLVSGQEWPSAFKGGTLVPLPPILSAPLVTDGAGGFTLRWSAFPSGLPPWTEFCSQVAVVDAGAPHGVALSNAVAAITP